MKTKHVTVPIHSARNCFASPLKRPRTVPGIFYGDAKQFLAECIGTVTCFVFIFAAFYAFFKLVDVTVGNRVSAEAELEGLDVPEMGVVGYPDFVVTPGPEGTSAA